MPAIHSAYLNLIRNQKITDVYLIDNDLVTGLIPRLERDIRALKADEVAPMLSSYFKDVRIKTLSKYNVASLAKNQTIIAPNEDVSRKFVDKYLPGHKVKFLDIFLRWDMTAANQKIKPNDKHRISRRDFDKKMMVKAESLAQKSPDWWRQVGALLAKDKRVIVSAYNQSYPNKNYTVEVFGDPRSNFDAGQKYELSKFIHAEAAIISHAAKQGVSTEGCSMYVTTFPCPACAKLIANAGIEEVYFKHGYSLLDAEDVLKAKKVKLIKVI